MYENSNSPTSSATLGSISLLNLSHYYKCLVIFLGLNLCLLNDEWFWEIFMCLFAISISSLVNCVPVFCAFFRSLFSYWVLRTAFCRTFCRIGYKSFITYLLSSCSFVPGLHLIILVSYEEQNNNSPTTSNFNFTVYHICFRVLFYVYK